MKRIDVYCSPFDLGRKLMTRYLDEYILVSLNDALSDVLTDDKEE